jgi:drug/metabolite transporter (DMT)-like permease
VGLAVLALLGASFWGVGDFLGGLASRRTHVLTVLVVSQAAGLVGAVVWVLAGGDARPSLEDLWPAVGAGAAGALGLGALYRGMAIGAMGIVAPISAASPIVPLAVDLARGIVPSALQWLGIVVVLGGIALLAHERDALGRRGGLAAGVSLALVAALGFGLFVVGLDAAADESVAWTILAVRSTSTVVALAAVIAVTAPLRPPARLLPMIIGVGAFDTAANVLVAFATTRGPAGIVAVLSALYPVTTILLARVLLAERLDRERRIGAVLALGGAAAVAVG